MPPPKVRDMMAWVEGRAVTLASATIPLNDHGFLFGDSVYETMRTYSGRLFRLEDHLVRLRRSAAGLRLPIPWSDEQFRDELERFRAHLPGEEHYLRLIVTRGSGELSYTLDPAQEPRMLVLGGPFVPVSERVFAEGLTAVVVSLRRNHPEALPPGLKTGNLLNARLSMMEAQSRGADEAILLNQAGELAEAASSNLFVVLPPGVLATPSLESGILAGVTRGVLLELAAELELQVREDRLPAALLEEAEEAFLSSTGRSIAPLRSVDGRPLAPVPGPVTARLMREFRERFGGL